MTGESVDRDAAGSWLRQQRVAAGLTQEELAERSGLSVRTVSNLERNQTQKPHPESIRRLMRAMGLAETASDELIARYRVNKDSGPGPDGQSARNSAGALLASSAPAQASAVRLGPVGVPRQLPLITRHFVGRQAELESLTGLLDQAAGMPGALVISAIAGTAGVGKTALALRWAHHVAARFPDGQLYANMRAFDPSGKPVAPADALAGFLRALGVPGPQIPAELDERAALYRTLMAPRQMLVVVDNAGSVEQVRPLLPGTAGCVALVTSRNALAGLVARDGAERLDLDLLPLADAVGLLRELIGARVDADAGAAAALAAQCARLPLALRVAAELAIARPAVALSDLAHELADRRRLDVLDAGGDYRTAVRAVFSWSYQHLDHGAARGFRLAGLHPGPDFDRYALAALAGTTAVHASELLDVLARAYLIHSVERGRYAMHDLLRDYARELVAREDGETEQAAAQTRLFDYFRSGVSTASSTMFPSADQGQNRLPATPAYPPLTDRATALAWLDAERPCLAAAISYTAEEGWPGHATGLAHSLRHYLENGGYFPEAIVIHACAQRAARISGDRGAEASALDSLGRMHWLQGRYQHAVDHLQQALDLFCETGDLNGQARVHANLGITDARRGHYGAAAERFRQALILFQETGDSPGQARALNNLGIIDTFQGRYPEAQVHLLRALALAREAGDRASELTVLNNLGLAEVRGGRHRQARDHLESALARCHESGDRLVQAHLLATLAEVDLQQDRYEQAVDNCQRSLILCREIGDRYSEVTALNTLGDALHARCMPGQAHRHYAAALRLATQIANAYGQAQAHNGLARSYHASGKSEQARRHWEQALMLYRQLGSPEAVQVRAQLTALAPPMARRASAGTMPG